MKFLFSCFNFHCLNTIGQRMFHLYKYGLPLHNFEISSKEVVPTRNSILEFVWASVHPPPLSRLHVIIIRHPLKDAAQLLDSLVLEGFAVRHGGNASLYRAKLHDRPLGTSGLSMTPCGVCPLVSSCHPGGQISPETCVYLDDFLFWSRKRAIAYWPGFVISFDLLYHLFNELDDLLLSSLRWKSAKIVLLNI